jgi:hypothetical protein
MGVSPMIAVFRDFDWYSNRMSLSEASFGHIKDYHFVRDYLIGASIDATEYRSHGRDAHATFRSSPKVSRTAYEPPK